MEELNKSKYIKIIIKEAKKSIKTDDIPVGAIIVEKNRIIAKAHNTREKQIKITGHAEINAINKASKKKKTWHLNDCELYVTLKPCKMCLEIIRQARIKRVYYIDNQLKDANTKEIELIKLNTVENSKNLITNFFKEKRKNRK